MSVTRNVIVYFLVSGAFCAKKFDTRITKYENGCPGADTKMNFEDFKLNKNQLEFKIVITEDITEDLRMEIVIERCLEQDAPGTCEKFHTLKVPFYCRILSMWSGLLDSVEPPFRCPFKKGIMRTKSPIVFDASSMGLIGISGNYYYKVDSKVYGRKSNKLISCTHAEGKTYLS